MKHLINGSNRSARALAALGAVVAAGSAHGYMLDNFSDGNSLITLQSGTQTTNTAASVPGGYRYENLTVGANLYGLNASAGTQGGAYTLNNDAGVYGYSYLGYGYGPNGVPTNMNFDLLSHGNTLQFDFAQIDPVLNFNVVIFTSTSYASYGINLGANQNGPTLNVPLSSFSYVGTAPDFHHVEEIYIEFNQSSGVIYGADIALTGFQAVPEPATFVALGLGLVPIALRRRRR